MFRRAETRERDAVLRDTRAINDKVRLLARLGTALIEARENGRPYAPGNRGLWLKVKCLNREEFVVVGRVRPRFNKRMVE
jgi:hypothetical protein